MKEACDECDKVIEQDELKEVKMGGAVFRTVCPACEDKVKVLVSELLTTVSALIKNLEELSLTWNKREEISSKKEESL